MKPPAFQFYSDDFLGGTGEMTAEEVGAYIRLLCHQWNKGGLPNDDVRLSLMAGQCQASAIAHAKTKFRLCEDGQLRNERLETERDKQASYREKQAVNGAKRWHGNAKPHAVALPTHMPKGCSPSPSPSPNKTQDAPASPWVVAFGIELPSTLQTQPCLEAVNLWLSYKRERKETYKPIGLKASLSKWSQEFTGAEFPSVVQLSIASGWKGLYRASVSQHGPSQNHPKKEISVFDSL
jgi:uncharacterized protein YdaU (DUF1376 family)